MSPLTPHARIGFPPPDNHRGPQRRCHAAKGLDASPTHTSSKLSGNRKLEDRGLQLALYLSLWVIRKRLKPLIGRRSPN
jgi:hypothetical protein